MKKNATKRPRGRRIPNTTFRIGQRIYCDPQEAYGTIVGYESDGYILLVDFHDGRDIAYAPAGDCSARKAK